MTVKAIKCPKCKDTIFSRARHDMRICSCKTVSIDGGFDYTRILHNPCLPKWPKVFDLDIKQTKYELYDDWNTSTDKFGIIPEKDGDSTDDNN